LRKTAQETEVTLKVRVQGSGPMAALWEAMSKPLLPQLAKSFAGQLKSEIEKATAARAFDAGGSDRPSVLGAGIKRLRNLWDHIRMSFTR
jgi:hypothetical protein